MLSESSPRLSFSDDLTHADRFSVTENEHELRRDRSLLLEPASDFEFCVMDQETSPADELFVDGVILPAQIRRCSIDSALAFKQELACSSKLKLPRRDDHLIRNDNKVRVSVESFWGIARSHSVHCETKQTEAFSVEKLPRSNSVPNLKGKTSKENHKGGMSRQQNSSYMYACSQKGGWRKNSGNGVAFSPVLNVPTPWAASLLGLGSFLKSYKEKRNKK